MAAVAPDAWTSRYLELLGVVPGPPDRAGLDALIRAHRAIAFECVSSLVRRHGTPAGPVPPLDLDELLTAWTGHRAGGVCFEVGAMLGRLLADLGYDVFPVLAQISFPGSHSALMARLDGELYLVDVGNGQPIFEAIAFGPPFEIHRAGLGYRFRVDPVSGKLVQDRFVDGAWKVFVTYESTPATPEDLEASYQRHHALPPETFVTSNFRLVRCTDAEVIQLLDHTFTRYTAEAKRSEEVRGAERYRELIHGAFGLSGMDVDAALRAWSELRGAEI